MKKYLIILLVGIISFLKIDNVSAAYTPSVSYANDEGEIILTCYSDSEYFSACQTGNNGVPVYYGADESSYKNKETAPQNICYMRDGGDTVIHSNRTCDDIDANEEWPSYSKQYLHKMEDVALSRCEYYFQEIGQESIINHNIYFELDPSSENGTKLITTDVTFSNGKKVNITFDGTSAKDESGTTISACKTDLYCRYYSGVFNISFEDGPGFERCNYVAIDVDEVYEEEPNKWGEAEYCVIFGENLTPIIKWILSLIRVAVAVIFVIMTIIDFLKIVGTGEEKSTKSAIDHFIKRLIIVLIVEVLPVIVALLIDISGILEMYGIHGDVFCSLFK